MIEQFLVNLGTGLKIAFQPDSLLFVLIGGAWGILGGALPGISATVTMTLLLPFTYGMRPEQALMMLAASYTGSAFGGAIPAVLIRTPGIPSALLTVVEGHQLHLQGRSGKAIGMALIGGSVGQWISIIAMMVFVIPLSEIGVKFSHPEIFALMVLGLTACASLTGKSVIKGLMAATFGVALGTIGSDPISGIPRFNFELREMAFGLEIIPVVIGMLALSEVLRASRQVVPWRATTGKFSAALPTWSEIRGCTRAILIASGLGFVVGALPGAGGSPAAFVSYQEAKRWSKHPEKFGKGSIEGVAAVETANNAVIGGELVPTLGLGVPGSVTTAVLLAALIIHGIEPGPMLLRRNPELVFSLFAGLMTAVFFVLVMGLLTIRPSIYITTLSRPAVLAVTTVLVTVGTYSLNWQVFDILVAWVFGVVGYFMYTYGFSPASAVLGVVLGSLLESNLRRGLGLSYGDPLVFLSRPATAIILLVAVFSAVYPLVADRLAKRRTPATAVEREVPEELSVRARH